MVNRTSTAAQADQTHRDRRPVQDDRRDHNRKHQEGALRRHCRARQQQIEKCAGKRRERGPFLDRIAQHHRRNGGEQKPDGEEQDASDESNVKSGYRQQMGEPGVAHGTQHMFGNGAAFSGD